MQPPILNDRVITIGDKEYRATPVMLVFYHMEDIGELNTAHKIHEAMKAGMHFHHTEDEIFDLMGKLTLPEIIEFLSTPPEGDEEENFPESQDADKPAELTDRFITEGPMSKDHGLEESPSPA